MKKLILLIAVVVLVMILEGSSTSAVSDTGAALTDSSVPNNELTNRQSQASNCSASGIITITMTEMLDE